MEIPLSAVREVTLQIGKKAQEFNAEVPSLGHDKAPSILVAQIDGSMVPTVEYLPSREGEKKKRVCSWKEFRLCTVTNLEEEKTLYGVTRGTPFEAGCMMYQTSQQQGLNEETHIHGVADGAPWIAEQYEEQFGMNHDFLLDFYHAAEYLAEVEKECTNDDKEFSSQKWLEEKKEQLKKGHSALIIAELKRLKEIKGEGSASAKAYQYFNNRRDQLHYDKAIEKELPIGSGEVESGHRSVLQARLKKPGAWWKIENAGKIAQIKVMQANENWHAFWKKVAA